MGYFNPYTESVSILTEKGVLNKSEAIKIQAVLENSKSPVTNKYLEKLYDSVLTKNHIDFGDIPKSQGDITAYTGYKNIIDILQNISSLASAQKSTSVSEYVKTIQDAISNLYRFADLYAKGYKNNNDYVVMEYQTFAYTIIQAVSTILYEFVDYVKRPEAGTLEITLKDTKHRANLFYIEQLSKYNNVVRNMEYRKFLEGVLDKGKDNFVGVETMIGVAVVAAVGVSIIPITRELVYSFYHSRAKLADCLAQQAYFLEMNKSAVESNGNFNSQKKAEILKKQENVKGKLLRLSDKLRVDHVMSTNTSKGMLAKDNHLLTIDNIKKEVTDSPLNLM